MNPTQPTPEEEKQRRERLQEILDEMVVLSEDARALERSNSPDEGPESDCFFELAQMETCLAAAYEAMTAWRESMGDEI